MLPFNFGLIGCFQGEDYLMKDDMRLKAARVGAAWNSRQGNSSPATGVHQDTDTNRERMKEP